MKLNAIIASIHSFFVRSIPSIEVVENTNIVALPKSAAHIEALILAKRSELDDLYDARHIALARERGQKAYRVDVELYGSSGSVFRKKLWSTSDNETAIRRDLETFMKDTFMQNFHEYFSGDVELTNLLTENVQVWHISQPYREEPGTPRALAVAG